MKKKGSETMDPMWTRYAELDDTELTECLFALEYLACERVRDGWLGYLVTFNFRPMGACGDAILLSRMRSEIEIFYRKLLPRIVRKPRTEVCPILIAAPDRPVAKGPGKKSGKRPSQINSGVHWHGVYLLPPTARLKERLDEYLLANISVFAGHDTMILELDIRPITYTPHNVAEYVCKHLYRRSFGYDEILILPRSESELPPRRCSPRLRLVNAGNRPAPLTDQFSPGGVKS